jgi:hypothetical protein
MERFTKISLTIALCAFYSAGSPAWAKPDFAEGKGKSHKEFKHDKGNKHGDHDDHGNHGSDRVLVNLDQDRVVVIRDKLMPYYQKHCPPGLAKKHNGCLPPGQAKKYRIGDIYHGHYWDVPGDVLVLLPAAPHGSRYIWADRDVLLISEATKKILDATVILSAM